MSCTSLLKRKKEKQQNSKLLEKQKHNWFKWNLFVRVCFRALKALWQYLGSKGVNTTLIWEKIKDIVIKTIIA